MGSSLSLPGWLPALRWLGFYPWLSSLRSFAVKGVDIVFLSGTCWLALRVLLCLWAPGSGGVPTLPVGSPISGPVGVLPQSTTATWLSLLWLGLLFVLVWFYCLRLTL